MRTLVIVTGGSSGIGRALLDAVPFADARTIDVSRSGGLPGVEHVPADLAEPEGWRAVDSLFQRELHGFDGARAVFVHCAGTLDPIGFAGEVDAAAYRRQVLLNSASPQVLGDAFLRAMAQNRAHGDLLMISSGAASSVYEGWTAYCAGKAAVDHWVRTAGAEQARRGGRVRVLAVAPGVVETAMQAKIRGMSEHDFPDLARFQELKDSGALRDPDDVAGDLWALLDRKLPNGSVLDLRNG